MKLSDIVWPAVLAVALGTACVLSGILGSSANIWAPLGLASITSALLAQRI